MNESFNKWYLVQTLSHIKYLEYDLELLEKHFEELDYNTIEKLRDEIQFFKDMLRDELTEQSKKGS